MRAREFLALVLPDAGYLIAATPFTPPGSTKKLWRNVVVDDLDELIQQCGTWSLEAKDVFYALASFEQRQVWNPNKDNWKDKTKGAFEKRTQANVKYLKSVWIDLDVGEKKEYATQADGFTALRAFCKVTGLPKPLVMNSGYGLHVYWPFDQQVSKDDWQPIANKLRDATLAFGLGCDTQCTADAARVLRPPGSRNFKQGSPGVPVRVEMEAGSYDATLLDRALAGYLATTNVHTTARKPRAPWSGAQTPFPGVDGNLAHSGPPLSADTLVWSCANFARQAADRGANGKEPEWYMALGLAQFCANPREVALSVSDAHPGFDPAYMDQKRNQWTGPPTCITIHDATKANEAVCKTCRHWGKIKSPASIGREVQEAPPLDEHVVVDDVEVKLPDLPDGYKRVVGKKGDIYIGMTTEDADGVPKTRVICPFDMYPKRVLRQTTGDDDVEESTIWIAKLSRVGAVEIKLPQALLSDPRKLHGTLLARGAHLNANEAKTTNEFMLAYLKDLARETDREQMFDRLGWHEDHHTFVTPNFIYTRGGKTLPHSPNGTIRAITGDSMRPTGDKAKWFNAIKEFYGSKGNEHNRSTVGFSWGAPLLHMTGHKGIMIAASGDTGRGKTTLLETGASIWGRPESLIVGGGQQGSTINGMFMTLGTLHSFPMYWDDTTEREAEEMRQFMLHISSGRDKIRVKGHVLDPNTKTWETIVTSSANTDDVHRILATGKDSNPHLMRLISVEFGPVDTSSEAKKRADHFKRVLRENFGHAGGVYLQHITQNHEAIQERVLRVMEKFDVEQDVEASERFWSAGEACKLVGTHIAYKLGLWPFDPFADIEWDQKHLTKMRVNQAQSASTSVDIMDEFLNNNISKSLIIQAKGTSNLDNIASRAYNELWIRNEVDSGLVYVSRAAFTKYCNEVKANFVKVQSELVVAGIILRESCHKVLGAGTPYAVGQTRCWEISMPKLRAHKGKI